MSSISRRRTGSISAIAGPAVRRVRLHHPQSCQTGSTSEPIREVLIHAEGVGASRRSMMRIIAMRTKAAAMRQCRSKWPLADLRSPRASRRLRLIQPMVRSTIQRFGSTTKRWRSQRRTISILQCPVRATAAAIFGPWYPASPIRRAMNGNRRRAWRSKGSAPSRSCTSAGCTITASSRPMVYRPAGVAFGPISRWRLRPTTVLPASSPDGSSVEPPCAPPLPSGCGLRPTFGLR